MSERTERGPEPDLDRYRVPAVESAGRILRRLAGAGANSTLTEIAAALELNKPSCMRILRTLESQGLVRYDDAARRYGLGAYLYILGTRASEQIDTLSVVLPSLRQTVRDTGLTAVMAQRRGRDRIVYVAKEDAPHAVGVSVSIGEDVPVTAGSNGKCALAWLSDDEQRTIVREVGLPSFTDASITDESSFLEDLASTRERGFAISRSQHFAGISGVAAPVFDASGLFACSPGVVGVAADIEGDRASVAGTRLRRICDDASAKLRGASAP